MRPVRIWAGLIFVILGILGIAAMAGTLDWDRTVDEWWPVAIIGWAVAEMLSQRSFDLDWSILTVFGVTLLADQQEWAIEGLLWTLLFLSIGAAILAGPMLRHRREARSQRQDITPVTPASGV